MSGAGAPGEEIGARASYLRAMQTGALTEPARDEADPRPGRDGPGAVVPRTLLLVNPNARRGAEALRRVPARLAAGGLEVRVETFASPAEVSPDILRRRAEVDRVVVCGGDGTVNAAAAALMQTGLPLGIVPLGTANDLARTLGIPTDIEGALEVLLRGRLAQIDVGSVNGHPFFNVATIGLGVDITRRLTPETKKRWGRLSYAVAASRVLLRARPFSAWIRNRGEVFRVKTLQIAVGNGVHYGGGNVVAETAAIDDGQLDLYSLELKNVWKLALMLRTFRSGRYGAWREVRTARCTEFEVETRRPRPISTDGELVTETPARFVVHPKAISVWRPAEG